MIRILSTPYRKFVKAIENVKNLEKTTERRVSEVRGILNILEECF